MPENSWQRVKDLLKGWKFDGEDTTYPWRRFRFHLESAMGDAWNDKDKFYMLMSKCEGMAKRVVCSSKDYRQAMARLEARFGSDWLIKADVRNEARLLPKIKDEFELSGLRKWLDAVQHWQTTLDGVKDAQEVVLDVFRGILVKLPERYAMRVCDLVPDLEALETEMRIWVERAVFASPLAYDSPKKPEPSRKCYNCRQAGHFANQCPSKSTEREQIKSVKSDQPSGGRAKRQRRRFDPPVEIPMEVDSQQLVAQLDLGCGPNILPEKDCPNVTGPSETFKGIWGNPGELVGPVTKEVTLGVDEPCKVDADFYVGDVDQAILGRNFLNDFLVRWDQTGNVKAVINGKEIQLAKNGIFSCDESEMMGCCAPLLRVTAEDLVEDQEEWQQQKLICEDSRIKEMLEKEFVHLFDTVGRTDIEKHAIELLPGSKPVCIPERKVPVKWRALAQREIEEMRAEGLIRAGKGEWAFPVVVIPKKDGSIRLAIDYRRLNEMTKKCAYPMPRVDEMLEALVGSVVFTKLDLMKGYYQVEMEERAKELTAFRFDGHLYEFNRMPFGLTTAPQTFQRVMHKALAGLTNVRCYLDDVIIFSRSIEEHRGHVRQVLEALEKAGLRLKGKKCSFAVKELEFLGFRLSEEGRRPSEEKIQAVRDFPRPKSVKEVERFVGLAGYYRDLIPQFANITVPLTNLTKKNTEFVWSQQCELAFQELKQRLVSNPVVRLPDFDKPFFVRTDASDVAMGAVLQQEENGKRHVVAYASQKFNSTQLRYPTIVKEATALMWALEKFRHYLLGGEFKIETDHKPLKWLRSMTNADGRLGRMARRLAEFQTWEIDHIPGKENVDADALSRIDNCIRVLIAADQVDAELDRRRQARPDHYVEENNQIFFVADGKRRLWVPARKRGELLKDVHDRLAHIGTERVMALARDRFYWPSMMKQIKWHVKHCETCARKKVACFPKAPLAPIDTTNLLPGDQWCMDTVELDPSATGKKYAVCLQDRVSKWPEALAVITTDAGTIIDWLEELFDRMGKPTSIVTDRGPQFESREFQQFLANHEVEHHLTSRYRHQCNGLAERSRRC